MDRFVNKINKIQNTAELTLFLWACMISSFHILLSLFRYVIDYRRYTPCIQWLTVGFVIAVFLYTVVFFIATKESRIQIIRQIKNYFTFEQIILIGILIWFILSCYLNQYYGVFRSYLGFWNYLYLEDWLLFDSAICFLLLFPLARIIGLKRAKIVMELIIHTVVVTYSVFTVICLWHIFHLETVVLPSGEQAGMTTDVQLMLGYHNNTTGMIAITMLCLCVYMILTQTKPIKIFYAFFGIVQLVVVYLSNCRTVFIAGLVFIFFISFWLVWELLKSREHMQRIGLSVLVATVAGLVFWYGREGMFVLFEKVTHFSTYLQKEAGVLNTSVNSGAPKVLSSRGYQNFRPVLLDVEGTKGIDGMRRITDVSSRFVIWSDCIKLLSYSLFVFFFGVTVIEFPAALLMIPGHLYYKQPAHAHNAILQIGVSMGVPAMVMFIAFLLFIAVKSLKALSQNKNNRDNYIVPGILLCFMIVNMAEAYLVGYFSVMACFFFLFCGWISAIDAELKKKDLNSSEEV